MDCLDDQTVAALVGGAITAGERVRTEAHLDGCSPCRRLVAAVAQLSELSARAPTLTSSADDEGPIQLVPGARIGRHVVMRLLGAGAMGLVALAYDAELDRRVAIKVLRRPGALRREALALARLQHPNVVTVHEIGVHDGHEYIVMELVDGQTAADWLAEPRRLPEILGLFVAVGRGLAAVHEAGLVHRDFKPSNVLVARDGRVRLGDLGMATTAPHPAGTLAGTPAYMSPEQKRGDAVDARSDQYSYCVALFEALTGSRPAARAPDRRPIPGWLRSIVERGLDAHQAARYPSMTALLAEIERRRGARRTRFLLLAGVLALGAAGLVGARARPAASAPVCTSAPAQIATVWSAERRARLTDALAASGRPHAGRTAELLAASLDGWSDGWQRGATLACRATRVSGEQSEALLDRRMTCYRRLLGGADEALRLLSEKPPPELVDKAQEIVGGLPRPEVCADVDHMGVDPPAPVRQHVAALDRELARAQALQRAGRYAPALALTDALSPEVAAVGFPPLEARHLALRGALLGESKDRVAEADGTLSAALAAAARAGDDPLAAEIWTVLLRVTGSIAARHDEALGRLPFAEAAVIRAGDPPLLRASLYQVVAQVYLTRHDAKAARPLLEQALALRTRVLGADHRLVGATQQTLCEALGFEGKLTEARPHCESALAILEATLGADHPAVGSALLDMANLAFQRGAASEAVAYGRRGLEIRERTYGKDHPATAIALFRLAQIDLRLHQNDEARAKLERVVAIDTRAFGADDPRTAQALEVHAWCLREAGLLGPAREELGHALAVQRKAWGEQHIETARTLADLGELERRAGDLASARKLLAESIAAYEHAVGGKHPALAAPLGYLGECELAAHRPEAAAPAFERALALPELEPVNGAQLRFGLARALWPLRDRDRALALAREAQAVFTAAPGFDEERAQVSSWVKEHQGI